MPRLRTNFPPIHTLITDFRQSQRRRNLTTHTAGKRTYKVQRLARWMAPRHALTASTADIECWLDTLPITPETRVTYITELRGFYGWAKREGWLRTDPSRDLARPRTRRSVPRPIPDAELAEALSTAPPRTLAILALMAYAGLRCVEVARLQAEDIDRARMVLRVERGKGDKTRLIPLHPDCLAALDTYGLPAAGHVFTSESPRHRPADPRPPLTAHRVSRVISLTLPGAYTAHQLRHWFGTMFYRTSRDLLLTQEVMGHASSATTAGYAKADTSRAAEVVGRMHLPKPADGPVDGEPWPRPDADPPSAARAR